MQKARLARIRIAKASSGAAFVSKKKAAEARLAAQESGLQTDDNYKEEDIFELQHHHLLRCLEKTTVRNEKTEKEKKTRYQITRKMKENIPTLAHRVFKLIYVLPGHLSSVHAFASLDNEGCVDAVTSAVLYNGRENIYGIMNYKHASKTGSTAVAW